LPAFCLPGAVLFSLPIFALFLGAFAIGTTEFVVTGILPNVAADLGVSIPTAGYLISGYAAGVAVLGPFVAIFTSRFERKATLVGLLALYVAGNALCALAPTYGWLMVARVILSLSHGSFVGIASVVGASLVAPNRRAAAVSMVLAGITVANIVGVPLGTAVGTWLGWRATFWTTVVVGIVAAVAVARWVPRGAEGGGTGEGARAELRALRSQRVLLSFAMIIASAAAFFSFFSYIAPVLTDVARLPPSLLPAVLSLFGVAALIGNLAGGWLADWKLMPSVIAMFLVQVAGYVALLWAVHDLTAAIVVLLPWFVVNFSFAAPLQARILKAASEGPNLAATLMATAFNIGISGGAALGSVALSGGLGYDRLPLLGIAGAGIAAVIALVSYGIERRAPGL
jgi:DHA1 family inner membrane transport protein